LRNPSETVLKALLSRCEHDKKGALVRFLPQQDQHRLDKMASFPEEVNIDGFANGAVLEKVHWSWFLPTLKTYSETEQKLFLSALTASSAKNLAKELTLSSYSQEMTDIAKSYLRQILLNSLIGPHDRLLPVEYLPATPLKKLLNCSKKELTKLIDLLSLHDLAAELRQIVETKILKKIYSLLSEEERKILKTAMSHKEHFVLSRMGLDRWDGSEETLRTTLHRRGLARLGAALSGQDPDFIWYVCHQLDIGRGNALFKQCAKEPIHGVSDVIIRQIETLL
jgi:hypothetical protein